MREIKFRAWDEQAKVMHEDFRFIKSGDDGNDWVIFTSNLQTLQEKHHPFDNPYFQQQFKVMQFTGLKDVNGVEIYEGDIVAMHELDVSYYESGKYCRGAVEFFNGAFQQAWTHDDGKRFYGELIDTEVCGNVHQNPELLK